MFKLSLCSLNLFSHCACYKLKLMYLIFCCSLQSVEVFNSGLISKCYWCGLWKNPSLQWLLVEIWFKIVRWCAQRKKSLWKFLYFTTYTWSRYSTAQKKPPVQSIREEDVKVFVNHNLRFSWQVLSTVLSTTCLLQCRFDRNWTERKSLFQILLLLKKFLKKK